MGAGSWAGGPNVGSRGGYMAETGGWRMRFVTADGLRSETGIISEPAHMYGVVEGGISRRSERGRGVED